MAAVLRKITNRNYNNTLLGESLEDLARRATAKTLPEPEPELIAAFVEAVQSSDPVALQKDLMPVLKRRLQMDNAHKQWLAIPLVAAVLRECREQLPSLARKEVLREVGEVATKPSTKAVSPSGEPVSSCMRKAKQAAFALLRESGPEGQDALRSVAGIGGAAQMQRAMQQAQMAHQSGQQGSGSWQALVAETTNCIQMATGHVELLQELLLGDGSGDFEEALVQDLMGEMLTFSAMFEPLLAALASVESPEAEALMAQALEAYDGIGNCQQLHADVMEARQAGLVGGEAEPAAAPASGRAPPTGAVVSNSAGGGAGAVDPFDMLGLGELAVSLEAANAAPAPASADPFALPAQQPPAPAPAAPSSSTPPPEEDPFMALATGAGTIPPRRAAPPPPQAAPAPAAVPLPVNRLSPDVLLADLTKTPPRQNAAPAGMSMKAARAAPSSSATAPAAPAAPAYSKNNPFAQEPPPAAAPATDPARGLAAQSSVDDEWDMFFKDRAAAPAGAQPADAFEALVQ